MVARDLACSILIPHLRIGSVVQRQLRFIYPQTSMGTTGVCDTQSLIHTVVPSKRATGRSNPATSVAVGTGIAPRPPHRSRRALLTHRAPPSGFGVETVTGQRVQHLDRWEEAV